MNRKTVPLVTATVSALVALFLVALPRAPLSAEDHAADSSPAPEAKQSVTEHSIRIDGQRVDYTATNYYIRHLDIPAEARDRIRYDLYPACRCCPEAFRL